MSDADEHEVEPHVHGPNCNHSHHHHAVEPARRQDRPGRNDPCWCGSGTKYKKCHLRTDDQQSS